MAKARSVDLSMDEFIKVHLSQAANEFTAMLSFLPLYSAAGKKNNTAAVRCLLNIGADPNIDASIMAPVILWAIYNQNLETLRLLLDHGARIWDVWCDRGLIKNWSKMTWFRKKETTEWDTKAAELIPPRVLIKALMVPMPAVGIGS